MPNPELRPHATIGAAVQALEQAANATMSAVGAIGRPTGEQLINGYLTWAENAASALDTIFEPDAVDDLIHTQHYWALRAAPGDAVRLIAQVQTELANRKRALTELASILTRMQQRWQGWAATLVVPDTNLFLQKNKPFEEIDWRTVADRSAEVRIVVPIVVIHELDRLKRQGNSTTAQSSRRALKWLAANLPSKPDQSSLLSSTFPPIRIEAYVHDGVSRPDDADGVIIQVAKRLTQMSEVSTKLVTYDLGMKIRAAAIDVEVLHLQDE